MHLRRVLGALALAATASAAPAIPAELANAIRSDPGACAEVSAMQKEQKEAGIGRVLVPVTLAHECVNSVPLDVSRDVALIDQ